jgi:hypothetical protein
MLDRKQFFCLGGRDMRFRKGKACWVSRHIADGWTLGLAVGNDKVKNTGVIFQSEKDVQKALHCNIVFIHKSTDKQEDKR